MNPFHYAFKVNNIEETRRFYIEVMNCKAGRSTTKWIDFDFYGHQLSAHHSPTLSQLDYCGKVDGIDVPIPHFGCILSLPQFVALHKRLIDHKVTFILPAHIRYSGEIGEQHTMFFLDPSNNPIEIKAFKHPQEIFSQ
ncbi:MAG: VOC family protein [Lishizhenia sp.]